MSLIIPYAASKPAFPFPPMPTPLTDEGRVFSSGNIIPHKGTLIDNINMPTAFSTTSTGDIVGKLNTSTIWTVNATDINAACDGWVNIYTQWYDSVNDRLYVFAVDIGTSPDTIFTAYITLETGSVTNVGDVQLGTDPSVINLQFRSAVGRTAIDSGNFTLTFDDRTIVINESTGAEVSNDASINVSNNLNIGSYNTLDGTIFLGKFNFVVDDKSSVTLTKGAKSILVPAPQVTIADPLSLDVFALAWGDKVKIMQNVTTSGRHILRTFLRSEFDAWLVEIHKFGGLA